MCALHSIRVFIHTHARAHKHKTQYIQYSFWGAISRDQCCNNFSINRSYVSASANAAELILCIDPYGAIRILYDGWRLLLCSGTCFVDQTLWLLVLMFLSATLQPYQKPP